MYFDDEEFAKWIDLLVRKFNAKAGKGEYEKTAKRIPKGNEFLKLIDVSPLIVEFKDKNGAKRWLEIDSFGPTIYFKKRRG